VSVRALAGFPPRDLGQFFALDGGDREWLGWRQRLGD
jgi:hypothetical protein